MRTRIALSVAFLSIVAAAPAEAGMLNVRGTGVGSFVTANSGYTGSGAFTFGGAYSIGSYATGSNYAKMCATSDPAQCSSTKNDFGLPLGPLERRFCEQQYESLHATWCAASGTSVSVAHEAFVDATVFDKTLHIVRAQSSAWRGSSSGGGTDSGLWVGGMKLYGNSGPTPITQVAQAFPAPYITVFAGTIPIGPIPVSISVQISGALGLQAQAWTMEGGQAYAKMTPSSALYGVVLAGTGTPGWTAGVQGTLEIVKTSAPFEGAISYYPASQSASYWLKRSLDITVGGGNLKAGLFAERSVPVHYPIVAWPGVQTKLPLNEATGWIGM